MAFPLQRTIGCIAMLENSQPLVEMSTPFIQQQLPYCHCVTLSTIEDMLFFFNRKFALLQEMESFFYSSTNHLPLSHPRHILDFWSNTPARFSIPKILVINQFPPSLDIRSLLELLTPWHGKRLLISNSTDVHFVSSLFNEEKINFFVSNIKGNFVQNMIEGISKLLLDYTAPIDCLHPWSFTLLPWQITLLKDQALALQLASIASDQCEYFVIGNPFGVLLLDFDGSVRWIQIETTQTLHQAAALAQSSGLSVEVCDCVREDSSISSAAIDAALGLKRTALYATSSTMRIASMNLSAFTACFSLDQEDSAFKTTCYNAWRDRQNT